MEKTGYKTSDYDYFLPEELIAQTPEEKRDHSRLMHLNRKDQSIEHLHFDSLTELLKPGDLLVVNDTKVLPARLLGKRPTGGKCELMLLRELRQDELKEETKERFSLDGKIWEAMVRPGKKLRPGAEVIFSDKLKARIIETREDGLRGIVFDCDGIFEEELEKLGEMPLPPYIHEKLQDKGRYQTVYAKDPGSAAAPTAGLHFTEELIEKLKNLGIDFARVTLDVGLGTFRPVKEDDILKHHMHAERYRIPEETVEKIEKTKAAGGRVIAVGTTSVRSLESSADENGKIKSGENVTSIFIYPGYKFKVVDALITNFHLPKSTLLMLVSAFYSREEILKAYETAVDERYRFFSFGDAMFIE